VKVNVISECVVGAAGLSVSEPECDGGELVLVEAVVAVDPEPPEPPELTDPDPPHPAIAPAATSTAAPAAGTRIRTRRASSTIDVRE
jgi:hypothetical protein